MMINLLLDKEVKRTVTITFMRNKNEKMIGHREEITFPKPCQIPFQWI